MSPARKKYTYDFPRPSVTVDVALVTREKRSRILLIRRKHGPFAGAWALPGGFIDLDETLEASARRELREETGVEVDDLEQLHAFGDPGRDPRGRTISVVFLARADADSLRPAAADDAAEVGWHTLDELPPLAFDHDRILAMVRQKVIRRQGARDAKAGKEKRAQKRAEQ
jgi:8-oxo-dGTP diphosphatase